METVAYEQQSDDQSVYTTDGITYTTPVLYGHNGAVDNTQTPKIYAFNTLEILYTHTLVICGSIQVKMFSSRCSLGKGADCGQVADLKHTMHYEFIYKGKQNAVCPKVTSLQEKYGYP